VRDVSIVIKGAGETASGIAHRLFMAHMMRICMVETENPLCVRRTVSFSEALFKKRVEVEGVTGTLARGRDGVINAWGCHQIGVVIDPAWKIIADLRPDVVVDAIMAKRNLGTSKEEAPVVIGIGPGFSAPNIVHAVIESNRGPNLGRAIYEGASEAFTGIPSMKAGYSWERVLRAPHAGAVRHVKSIGDPVCTGETVLYVDTTPVQASIDGTLRGVIREMEVGEREKLGDIEPASRLSSNWTISDKALAIGGGVLEAVRHLLHIEETQNGRR
jgi:xanthine dehydrogenase accessory factor